MRYTCCSCKLEKKQEDFYSYFIKKKHYKCKKCHFLRMQRYQKEHPDIVKKRDKNFSKKHYGRICPCCKEKFWKVSSAPECSTKCKLLNRSEKKDNGCWEWIGGFKGSGYPEISIDGTKNPAHRVCYEYFKEKIPENSVLLHKCDNRICINPEHLLPGSIYDNNKDKAIKGRCNLNNPNRIKEEDVRMIKDMKKRGLSVQEIKKAIGKCSLVHIRNILRGDAWAHVE